MKILYAAPGKARGGFLDLIRAELPEHPIFQYNVLATPHIADSTDVSMRGVVKVVADNIRRVEKNMRPLYCR